MSINAIKNSNDSSSRLDLWPHQKQAVEAAANRAFFALFMEMGTGKTGTLINILAQNFAQEGKVRTTLILAPLIVCENWKKEFIKFAPKLSEFVQVLSGSGEKKIFQVKDAKINWKNIYITNHEALSTANWQKIHDEIGQIDTLVVDESHRFKDPTGKRFKVLKQIALKAKHRYLLTGTPVLQSLADIWPQAHLLSPDIFEKNYFSFRNKYFYDANESFKNKKSHWPNYKLKPGAEEQIKSVITPHSFSVKKEECLTLPPLIQTKIELELTPEQKKIYSDMERDFVAELDGNLAVTTLAITKMLRLQQFCSGIFKGIDGKISEVPTAKYDALFDLLDSILSPHNKNKVIIWTNFTDTYEKISDLVLNFGKKGLGWDSVMLTGQQTQKQKEKAVQKFQEDETTRVIIANQAAGGTGVNLQAANYSIYFSKNYNLADDLQSQARNYRGGSEIHEKIIRYDLVTKGTVEEDIELALAGKQSMAEFFSNIKRRAA